MSIESGCKPAKLSQKHNASMPVNFVGPATSSHLKQGASVATPNVDLRIFAAAHNESVILAPEC
eukprot:scaffold211894_cov34-Tisochrysis_lutea.AAC.5